MKQMITIILCLVLYTTSAFAGTFVDMTKVEKDELDTFFSTFSQTWLDGFAEGDLTDEIMLHFAESTISDDGLKKTDENHYAIPTTLIDQTTEKYFGKRMTTHKKTEYIMPVADGEAWRFSQINTLERMDENVFLAKGTIYVAGSGAVFDEHAIPADWKKQGEDVETVGPFTARIRKLSQNGKDRYILLDYRI